MRCVPGFMHIARFFIVVDNNIFDLHMFRFHHWFRCIYNSWQSTGCQNFLCIPNPDIWHTMIHFDNKIDHNRRMWCWYVKNLNNLLCQGRLREFWQCILWDIWHKTNRYTASHIGILNYFDRQFLRKIWLRYLCYFRSAICNQRKYGGHPLKPSVQIGFPD